MRGVNKVIIIGNLGADPEARQFNNGGSVTNISVATSEQWTDKQSGEKREATEWHRVSLFNRLGEIAAKYQAPDGSDRYATEIRADQMQMLDGISGSQDNGGPSSGSGGGYDSQGNGQTFNQSGQGSNAPQGIAQGGYKNQGSQAPQNQFNAPSQAASSKSAPMPDGPVDDDIPF